MRATTVPCVLVAMDSLGCLSFAGRRGSSNSINHFVESLKTIALTSDNVLLTNNVTFHYSRCGRAFCQFYWVEQPLFIPLYFLWLNPIEKVFSIVKRDDRSTERITEAFSTG
jgi:transposase